MICPDCEGTGTTSMTGFVHYADGGSEFAHNKPFTCFTCKGTKTVDDEYPARKALGKEMRAERLERQKTSRYEADRLGVSFAEWSRIETGRPAETPEGQRAWNRRVNELKGGL